MNAITKHVRARRAPVATWALLLAALALAAGAAGCGGKSSANGGPGEAHADHAEDAGHAPEAGHADEGEHGHDEHAESEAVELTPAAVANARIAVGVAGPANIAVVLEAPGEVHLDAERVFEVRPRYAGVLRDVRKRIGDHVAKGEVVAVVQANESLTDYEIHSSLSGTVIARPVVNGQAVDHENVLMTIADLTHVWADFAVYPQYVGRVRQGMAVSIEAQNRPETATTGRVHYVGPLLEQDTRVSSARVVLANTDGRWQPGLFVTARVTLEQSRVGVAVPEAALVRTTEGPALFVAHGTRFELRHVTTGRTDGRTTEITGGVAAGDSVVVANAFVLKSELGKGEGGHEH